MMMNLLHTYNCFSLSLSLARARACARCHAPLPSPPLPPPDKRCTSSAGHGKPFAGDYSTKGLYAYSSGKFDGMAFFGINGTAEQMEAPPDERGGQYRPVTTPPNHFVFR